MKVETILLVVCTLPGATGFAPLSPRVLISSSAPTPHQADRLTSLSPFGVSSSLFLASGEDISLEDVESLSFKGKGKGGKRGGDKPKEGGGQSPVTLAPEETFYEGPPAITETFIPTLSILTVIGIIPAVASYSRQAWVRYKVSLGVGVCGWGRGRGEGGRG